MSHLELEYQIPIQTSLPESGSSKKGRRAIRISTAETLLWVSVQHTVPKPNLFISIFCERDPIWQRFLKDGYIRRSSVGTPSETHVLWEGFFFPRTEFDLVIRSGGTNATWVEDDIRISYQTAVVKGVIQ